MIRYYSRFDKNKTLASRLNKYVVVEEKTSTSDNAGGFTQSWGTVTGYGAEPAAVEPASADRIFEYRSQNVNMTHHIILRGYVNISKNNRIKWDDNGTTRYFEVLTVEELREDDVYKFVTTLERDNW